MKMLFKSSVLTRFMSLMLVISSISLVYAENAQIKELREALTKQIPQAANAEIKATPMKGLFEVMLGSQILYISKDARYVFDGDMIDMQSKTNLTEGARSTVRVKSVDALGEENMLVYMPKGDVKHTITIFTDIYCPYCQRLHQEMDDYMKNGVKVRYIFVPFKGEKSVAASISVWCAKDRTKAMDMAKSGKNLEPKKCENPISKHQALASALGVRGTPAIMLENGLLMPGYVPSGKVIEQLNGLH